MIGPSSTKLAIFDTFKTKRLQITGEAARQRAIIHHLSNATNSASKTRTAISQNIAEENKILWKNIYSGIFRDLDEILIPLNIVEEEGRLPLKRGPKALQEKGIPYYHLTKKGLLVKLAINGIENMESQMEEFFSQLNPKEKEFKKILAKLMKNSPNFTYSIFQKYVRAFCEEKIEDLKIKWTDKRDETFRLLYIGVLEKHPSRGIIETIKTVSKMKGIQFDIGGFGTLVPTIKKIQKNTKNVNYMGSIHPDNVALKTIECDAVLMALDPNNVNNKLSAPNKLFEAMAAGVPLITCKELLMGQFVEREEIGLTFEWGKWDPLKAVLMKMMFDENLCLEMGKRGRRLAERVHNWEYCEDRIESLYRFVKKSRIPKA